MKKWEHAMKPSPSLIAGLRQTSSILARRIAFQLLSLGAALMLVKPCAADPFEFELTGHLAVTRAHHTLTLLQNGKVLVVGGHNVDVGSLATAELYDPATGTWSSTGSLDIAREGHTAALLQDGKVLVAGGYNNDYVPLTSTEIYDPDTGTWAVTGNLHVSRRDATATLLPNGKVLVAGGHHAHVETTSAELYDPNTGTWTITGSMLTGRNSHTATLLQNGKVLVASGYGGGATCEVYDPATGTWSATGSLSTEREGHTATLLANGKVLVAAGTVPFYPPLTSAELYDPDSGTWSFTGSLATERYLHTATLLQNGKVIVTGGANDSGILGSAELYDPTSGTWSGIDNLVRARAAHTATLLLTGKVLVACGSGDGNTGATAELGQASGLTQITPAAATCSQFSSGNAETLANMEYGVNNLLITRVNPLNFLYWVTVTAPAGNNIFTVTQTITTGNFDTLFPLVGNGSNVFDSNCVALQRSLTQNGDTVTVRFNAPVAGTHFIAIKFNSQNVIGRSRPDPKTVHYDFTTTGVLDSTSGLDLVLHPKP
jgi:hypothetical protein